MPDAKRVSAGEVAACLAWPGMLFALGWMAVAALDFLLRSRDGPVQVGGVPRDVWLLSHAVLAAAIASAAWTSWRRIRPVWRVGMIVLQLSVGFPVYLIACVAYGISLGLDSF